MRKKVRKVPTVLQMEVVECGAASLTMILGYFRKYVALEEVREKCGVSRDGSKASSILKAARSYGLQADGYRKDPETVLDLEMPLIIHWNMNHFLVLEGYHNGKYYLNDPAGGRRTVAREAFHKSFSGIAMAFEKTPEFEPSGKKQMAFAAFIEQLEKYKKELYYISFTGFLAALPPLMTAWMAMVFLDEVWMNQRTDWLFGLLSGLAAVALLKAVSSRLSCFLNYRLLEKIRINETSRLIWKTMHLPAAFFMQRYIGEISARVKNIDNVALFLAADMVNAAASLLVMLVFACVMLTYNGFLTAAVLALFAVNMLALAANAKIQENISNRISMSHMKLMGASISDIQLIETIKATSAEQASFERWAGHQAKLIDEKQEAGSKIQGFLNLPSFISMAASIMVLWAGGYLIIKGSMTVGTLVAFQSILSSFFSVSATLNRTGIKLPKIMADIKRIEDIYCYDREKQSKTVDGIVESGIPTVFEGSMRVESLTFGFSPYEEPLIRDFSLELKPGQRVALVGGSGSGKSTIAKLISGIYTPWSGDILLDNKPVHTLPRYLTDRAIAMVDQEIVLFSGTVADNISLWQQEPDESKLIQAAKNACIHSDIVCRPGGYGYHMLEDGQDFSGGQRQRIEIARAFLQDPCIMILDEATSALDPAIELEIDMNLRKLGCSCIIVAHRLSTIRDCDEIIVLNKGKIVQRGTHDSLLQQEGLYSELIKTM